MNSFDALRLLAALMVVFHHSLVLSGHPSPSWAIGGDLGVVGVGIFFVISGHLICASFERSATVSDYLSKRALRIFPALIVAVALTALVLGPMVSSLSPATYFREPQTWLYIGKNALLFPVDYALPGVFADAPLPGVVNGSLWTLRLEFTCYLALAGLGLAGLLRRSVVGVLAICAGIAALSIEGFGATIFADDVSRLVLIACKFGFLFLTGAWAHLYRRAPPLWSTLASAALLATPFWILGLPLVTLAIGRICSPRPPADISYGLYIYAFPIQQVLAAHGMLSFPASVAATMPLALVSWYLVEKPALRLKPSRTATDLAVAISPHGS